MTIQSGDAAPWNAAPPALPPEAGVPTMMTEEERRLLFWLAARPEMAEAEAADLGCFAGGSTAPIAAGMAAAGHPGRVHAYDWFTISDAQKERYLAPAGVAPFAGDDLLPVVERFLAPFGARIALHRGDIAEARWEGGALGLLFVDAAKTPASADRIAAGFVSALQPGAVVVQQDYFHWRQPWVAAQMELLAPCFELAGWCQKNTAFFRCVRAPERRDLAQARVAAQSDTALIALLKRAIARYPKRPQRAALARAVMALEDHPGERNPRAYQRSGFTPERVGALIAKT